MKKILLLLLVVNCYESQTQKLEKFAKSYEVLKTEDMSIKDRTRKKFIIKSESKTHEEICGTLIKSSKDFQSKNNLKTVYVFLADTIELAEKGKSLGIGSYAPDGNGNATDNWTWELKTLNDDTPKHCLLKN